ncbi:hypothetical protein PLESTB_000321200 [Pleodorina starrii]|uniref:Guanylate cyclase domain-containing protein n=1 Tax=Pleodorina starrii TaxID=330485 RepID=A0A9W6EYM0_9CHLO|nr:hypothetical protein PLESTB_000321200 [Pleodorina starrii]
MVEEVDRPGGSGLWKGIVRVPPSLKRPAHPPPPPPLTLPNNATGLCGLQQPRVRGGTRSGGSGDGGGGSGSGGFFGGAVGASAVLLSPDSASDHDLDPDLDPGCDLRQPPTGPSGLAGIVGGGAVKRGSASGGVGVGAEWGIGPEAEVGIPLPSSLLGPEDEVDLLPLSQLECGDLKTGVSAIDPRVAAHSSGPRWPAAAAAADADAHAADIDAADTAAAAAAAATTTTTAATATATAAITEGHSSLILANSTSYGSHRWYDTTGTYGSRPSAQRAVTANSYLAGCGSYITGGGGGGSGGGGGGMSRRMFSGTDSRSASAAAAPTAKQLLPAFAASPCGQRRGGRSRPASLILPTNTSENAGVAAGGMNDPLATSTFATLLITPPPTPAVRGSPAAASSFPRAAVRAPVLPGQRRRRRGLHRRRPRSLAFALSLGTSPLAAPPGSWPRRRATTLGTVSVPAAPASASKTCFIWSKNDQGLASVASVASAGGGASALASPAVSSLAAAAPPPLRPPSAPVPYISKGAAGGVPYTVGGSRLARLLRSPLGTTSSAPPTPPSGAGGGAAGGVDVGGTASPLASAAGGAEAGLRRRSSTGTARGSPGSAAAAVLNLMRGLGRRGSVPGARVSPLPRAFSSVAVACAGARMAAPAGPEAPAPVQDTAAAATGSELGPFAAATVVAATIAAGIAGPSLAPAVSAATAERDSGRGVRHVYETPPSPFLTLLSSPLPPSQPPQPVCDLRQPRQGQPPQGLQPQRQQPLGQQAQRLQEETGDELLLRLTARRDLEGVAGSEAVMAAEADGEEAKEGGGEGQEPAECWHEVWATASTDPTTGDEVVVLIQTDVTSKVIAERHLALVMETEHRLVEQLFPRHILQYITEEWTSTAAGAGGREAGGGGVGAGAGGGAAATGGGGSDLASSWRPVVRDCNALATSHPEVTLLFADIKGFTPMCNEVEPRQVMALLNSLYSRYDTMLDEYGVYKVETIGDCYFVAGGLIHEDEDGMAAVRGCRNTEDPLHAERVLGFAKAMLSAASEVLMPTSGSPVEIRIGLHTGPVVSGVVGTRMPRFCLFGDTVNTASRMESTGLPGAIHASEATFRKLAAVSRAGWEATGGIEVKGKGLMQTYVWRPSAATANTAAPAATDMPPTGPHRISEAPPPAAASTLLPPAPQGADSNTDAAAAAASNGDNSTSILSLELPKQQQQQQAPSEHALAPTIGCSSGNNSSGPIADAAPWRCIGDTAADSRRRRVCQRAEPSLSGFDIPRSLLPPPPLHT